MHTITITLTQAAQRAALLAGLPAALAQTYEVEEPALLGRLLALPWTKVSTDGHATCVVPGAIRYTSDAISLPPDAPVVWTDSWGYGATPSLADVRPDSAEAAIAHAEAALAAYVACVIEERRKCAAQAVEQAARTAAFEAADRAEALRWAALPLAWRVALDGVCIHAPLNAKPGYEGPLATSGVRVVSKSALREYAPDALASAETEVARLRQVRAQAEEAKAEAETAARAAWIEEHGSERLRLLLAGGYELAAAYRGERLAVELPGWNADPNLFATVGCRLGETMAARNPPLEALHAAAATPDASLVYAPQWRTADADEDGDEDGEVRDGGVYLLQCTHLGRTVYRAT